MPGAPRIRLALAATGIARLPVSDERAEHARVRIRGASALEEPAAVEAVREGAVADQLLQLLLVLDVRNVEQLVDVRRDQLGHVQQQA